MATTSTLNANTPKEPVFSFLVLTSLIRLGVVLCIPEFDTEIDKRNKHPTELVFCYAGMSVLCITSNTKRKNERERESKNKQQHNIQFLLSHFFVECMISDMNEMNNGGLI